MSAKELVGNLFANIGEHAKRNIEQAILDIDAETYFPTLPDEDEQGKLLSVAELVGGWLAVGTGDISAEQLHTAVELYYLQANSPYCPPILDALATLL